MAKKDKHTKYLRSSNFPVGQLGFEEATDDDVGDNKQVNPSENVVEPSWLLNSYGQDSYYNQHQFNQSLHGHM